MKYALITLNALMLLALGIILGVAFYVDVHELCSAVSDMASNAESTLAELENPRHQIYIRGLVDTSHSLIKMIPALFNCMRAAGIIGFLTISLNTIYIVTSSRRASPIGPQPN